MLKLKLARLQRAVGLQSHCINPIRSTVGVQALACLPQPEGCTPTHKVKLDEPYAKAAMVTNIEMTAEELAELQAATDQSDPSAAIRVAMEEYLRYVRRMQLKQLSGQVTMEENWQQLEQAELDQSDGTN
jgi:hypothetical protein